MSEAQAAAPAATVITAPAPAPGGAPAAAPPAADPATPPAAAPAAAPPAPAAAPPADPAFADPMAWSNSLSEDRKGYVNKKGFKDVSAVVDSYLNLEKLIGEKDSLLKIPGESSTPEQINEVYTKLGKPAKAEDYKLAMPAEGGDQALIDWSKQAFHDANLTQAQAEAVITKWNERTATTAAQAIATKNAELLQQTNALKTEWGAAYEENAKLVERAANGFGMDDKTLLQLRETMGAANAMKFLHSIGSKMGEDSFIHGSQGSGMGVVMTPADAKSRIKALQSDKEWTAKYLSGDVKAKEEMGNLHKWAFG